MIRINKPVNSPPVLLTQGRQQTGFDCANYERNAAGYDNGTLKFSFTASIYGHDSVKDALIQAQHGKCCFCEAKITHISYGDVEHFRPKAGYRQDAGDPLGRPGYYWLAYEWSNLYLCCQLCNQRHKKNFFPLEDANLRCRNHQQELNLESSLFIDPGVVDPEDHIEFKAEQPVAKNGSRQGETTIEALGLRREPLRERRFDRYKMLSILKDVAKLLPNDVTGQEAIAFLNAAVEDAAEYASMARSLTKSS